MPSRRDMPVPIERTFEFSGQQFKVVAVEATPNPRVKTGHPLADEYPARIWTVVNEMNVALMQLTAYPRTKDIYLQAPIAIRSQAKNFYKRRVDEFLTHFKSILYTAAERYGKTSGKRKFVLDAATPEVVKFFRDRGFKVSVVRDFFGIPHNQYKPQIVARFQAKLKARKLRTKQRGKQFNPKSTTPMHKRIVPNLAKPR